MIGLPVSSGRVGTLPCFRIDVVGSNPGTRDLRRIRFEKEQSAKLAQQTHVSSVGILDLSDTLLLKSVLEDLVKSVGVERDSYLDGTRGATELLVKGVRILLGDFRDWRIPSTRLLIGHNNLWGDQSVRLSLEGVFREVSPIPARVSELFDSINILCGRLDPAEEVHVRATTQAFATSPDMLVVVGILLLDSLEGPVVLRIKSESIPSFCKCVSHTLGCMKVAAYCAGTSTLGSSLWKPPASRTRTLTFSSSVKRVASAKPAVC